MLKFDKNDWRLGAIWLGVFRYGASREWALLHLKEIFSETKAKRILEIWNLHKS